MPQMPAVQPNFPPSTPQVRPPGSAAGNAESSFSPHLKNAVSGKKPEQQAPHGDTGRTKLSDIEHTGRAEQTDVQTDPQINTRAAASSKMEIRAEMAEAAAEQTNLETDVPDITAGPSAFLPAYQHLAELQAGQRFNRSPAAAIEVQGSPGALSALGDGFSESARSEQPAPITAGRQEALVNQLQNIIASSRNADTAPTAEQESPAIPISVDKNFYSSLSASLAGKMESVSMSATGKTAELSQNGLLLADGDSLEYIPAKPLHQLTGIRHETQQQYFATKINTETLADNSSENFQDNQPDSKLAQQTPGTALSSSPLGGNESASTFSTLAPLAQDPNLQAAADTAKPIILPSGTIVHEQEIMQQLAEKFRLSSKNIDSRINLKLHPAELGELKIDLILKDGAIRANIVAQSQHTLEILEKNLPRLKSILENQGFDIEQIALTSESGSVSDFDLFDRQLFSGNDYQPAEPKGRQKEHAVFVLDELAFTSPAVNTGVNVKI